MMNTKQKIVLPVAILTIIIVSALARTHLIESTGESSLKSAIASKYSEWESNRLAKLAAIKAKQEAEKEAELAKEKLIKETEEKQKLAMIKAEEKKKQELLDKWKKLSKEDKDRWYSSAVSSSYYKIKECAQSGGYPLISENNNDLLITGAWSLELYRGDTTNFKYSVVYKSGMTDVFTFYASLHFKPEDYNGYNYSASNKIKCVYK
ncbi:hypothetical protein JYB88_07695 [Shewanella cyperi]|uniref:Uncharacterized protein n=1 Tax=Shewanella cyperi TaxID=2814292 RepID=A0A975AMN0_9GAMM|nr:hypothetical protein [Shewanella cyperi]QSX31488.1 hypothetical protein JYB88_07695 [Shewanella cyperi]